MADAPEAQTKHRSVLIADIVSSVQLYERHGNIVAQQMVDSCLKVVSDAVGEHKGRVIKSLGDGILSAFDSEEHAVWAAVAMCDQISSHDLDIRVGIHCGEVVEDGGDIFGDAVNTASRITHVAKGSEVLLSAVLKNALPTFMQNIARKVQPVSVKGKREPLQLYAILRDSDDAGDISQTICLARDESVDMVPEENATLELVYQDNELSLGPQDDLTIGREVGHGLVVPSKHVSRYHARVFHRGGKFHIEDKSANGTFLVPDQQNKLRIYREEGMLYGSGKIFLGADPDRSPSEPIVYRVE